MKDRTTVDYSRPGMAALLPGIGHMVTLQAVKPRKAAVA
jgi:hypothetical protein